MYASKSIPVHQLIRNIGDRLHKKYCDHTLCIQYAWWVLEAITEQRKSDLLSHTPITLTPTQDEKLECWITNQVEQHIPLQYLIGSVPFLACDILVEPPILIPRQETEAWCADLIKKLQKVPNQSLRILDVCTGSGCIAIALAKTFPNALVYALDISEQALSLTKKNANHNQVSINLILSDLFTNVPQTILFDIIVSNPPYISQGEWSKLDPSVKEWEDSNALIAPDGGLGIIQQIITKATDFLDPQSILIAHHVPQLIIEIGHSHSSAVKTLYRNAGFKEVIVEKDLHGHDRIAAGYKLYAEQTTTL